MAATRVRKANLWAPSVVVVVLAFCETVQPGRAADAKSKPPATFEKHVLPILTTSCLKCHGADKPKAGLDLRTPATMLRGGDNGPVLVKGNAAASALIEKVVSGTMPPGKAKLSNDQVRVLRDWIDAGAPAAEPTQLVGPVTDRDRQHWAFRPASRPPIPRVRTPDQVRTPIDAFLLARLEAKGLHFAPDADRATLLRRASLDLLGLPPTPEAVDAFLGDGRLDAYERAIDQLLASPHFGERWGRHWLDVAGYTDTVGFDQDSQNIIQSEGKWRYRDYVIAALNEDLPYDRFVTEQLAGDELVDWRNAPRFTPEIRRLLVATGYLRTARDQTHEDVGVDPQNFFNVLHDTVAIVGNGLLGLTLNCAECHSHKFDPIPQRDYYRMMALFTPAYNPRDWRPVFPYEKGVKDRALPDVSPAELAALERQNEEVERNVQKLHARIAALQGPHEARLRDQKLQALPEPIRADTRAAVDTPAGKRSEVQKYLAGKFAAALRVKPEEVTALLSPGERAERNRLNGDIAALHSRRQTPGKIQALYDLGPPPPTHLLRRGNYETRGDEVAPGFLSVLDEPGSSPLTATARGATSGRRLALARWLTQPGSRPAALVARVMVNRLWQHLFGQGLVPTPENFGRSGEPPTHPELLEWLAAEFAQSGWRIKPTLKRMMMSTAYRQSSRPGPRSAGEPTDPETIDPGNRLLGRMRLRRLEAEAIRDTVLAVSGRLNRTMAGPPVVVRARADGLVEIDQKALAKPAAGERRSVYLLCRRSYNLSLLTVFDQPLVAHNCPCRDVSAVPLQSLAMLNDAFMAEQARYFAERVERSAGGTGDDPVVRAFRLGLTRMPSGAEAAICRRLLERQAAAFRSAGLPVAEAERRALGELCHTLLNTSEFLYVE